MGIKNWVQEFSLAKITAIPRMVYYSAASEK